MPTELERSSTLAGCSVGGRWSPAAVAVVGLLAGLGWYAVRHDVVPFLAPDQCTAEVGGHAVVLDPSQARYAGLITAIAVERGLPARAASIALAAAYQESDLRNLRGGDRDSAGLFQQRPSQGWGTVAEVRDPVHATNAFYDALVQGRGLRAAPDHGRRAGGPAVRLPGRVRRPRGRCPGPGLGPDRQLARGVQLPARRQRRRVDRARGLRAHLPRRRRTPRPPRTVPGPAAGRLRSRWCLHRPHGGVGALRGPSHRRRSSGRSRRPTGPAGGRSRSTSSARPTGSRSRR